LTVDLVFVTFGLGSPRPYTLRSGGCQPSKGNMRWQDNSDPQINRSWLSKGCCKRLRGEIMYYILHNMRIAGTNASALLEPARLAWGLGMT